MFSKSSCTNFQLPLFEVPPGSYPALVLFSGTSSMVTDMDEGERRAN